VHVINGKPEHVRYDVEGGDTTVDGGVYSTQYGLMVQPLSPQEGPEGKGQDWPL